MNSVSNRLLLATGLVILAVGLVDAAISAEWDLFVVFAMAIGVVLVVFAREAASRRAVTLRSDLAVWVERRAERSGEPFDDLLDRAVAHYKHALFVEADADA